MHSFRTSYRLLLAAMAAAALCLSTSTAHAQGAAEIGSGNTYVQDAGLICPPQKFYLWCDGTDGPAKATNPLLQHDWILIANYVKTSFRQVNVPVIWRSSPWASPAINMTSGENHQWATGYTARVLSPAQEDGIQGTWPFHKNWYRTIIIEQKPTTDATSKSDIPVGTYHYWTNPTDWNNNSDRPGLVTVITDVWETDYKKSDQVMANVLVHELSHAARESHNHCSAKVASCVIDSSATYSTMNKDLTVPGLGNAVPVTDSTGQSGFVIVPWHDYAEIKSIRDGMCVGGTYGPPKKS